MQTNYFENKLIKGIYKNNIFYPGIKTSLSSREEVRIEWGNVKFISKSPENASSATVSIQMFENNDADVLLDKITMYEIIK